VQSPDIHFTANRFKYEQISDASEYTHVVMDETALFSASDFLNSIGARIDGFMYRGHNSNDYAMIWLSDGFARLTGHDGNTFIRNRTGFATLIVKEDLPKVDAAVADALSRGGNWQVSYRICHRDGRILYVHETGGASATINPNTGEPAFLDGIILEASALSRLAERLTHGSSALDKVEHAASDITGTLKTLRLLALNARIEAARAAEYGASFGVVAQEMTSLADKGESVTNRMSTELAHLRDAIEM